MPDTKYVIIPQHQLDKLEEIRKAIWEIFADLPNTDPHLHNMLKVTPKLWAIANRKYPELQPLTDALEQIGDTFIETTEDALDMRGIAHRALANWQQIQDTENCPYYKGN